MFLRESIKLAFSEFYCFAIVAALFSAVLVPNTACAARAEAAYEFLGTWQFHEIIIDGKRAPRPNPDLTLIYQLRTDSVSQLYWSRKGDSFYCLRQGHWTFESGTLIDHIEATDPKNGPGCADDPDMKVGVTTRTKANIENGELQTEVLLGDKNLIYIWQRIPTREFP